MWSFVSKHIHAICIGNKKKYIRSNKQILGGFSLTLLLVNVNFRYSFKKKQGQKNLKWREKKLLEKILYFINILVKCLFWQI